jgi:excisionase family DNA binding protein
MAIVLLDGNDFGGHDDVVMFSIRSVAKARDCSVRTIYRKIKRGELEVVRFGPRCVRITKRSLLKDIAANGVVTTA